MKLRPRTPLVLFAFAGATLLTTVPLVPGVLAAEGAPSCSLATLNGEYGFYRSGSTAAGTLAAVGIVTYDGQGNSMSTQSVSRAGVFDFDVQGSGSYEINEDCTGKQFRAGVEIARFVVVDGGNGFYILSENAGNAVYGVGKRIRVNEN